MSGFSLASIKNQLDEVRAQVYPRNETERKVYEALSSKNWGASSTLLNEIASDSNDYEKYTIMSTIIWASLDTDGKSWKQIFKALTLIDFLIKNGTERFIEASRDKLYKIRTLQDFNYYEGTVDKGSGVREKAKQLVEMLGNNEIIRSERDKSRQLRNKFVGIDSRNVSGGGGGSYDSYSGGGNDSYGGRYGNDNNSNYRNNDSGNKYGGHGNDSYSSNSSNNRRGSDSGATPYGGGAYNSDRPPRYGDDAPSQDSSNRDQWEEAPSEVYNKNKPFASKAPAASAPTTGKLKVNIKKVDAPAAANKPAAPAAPEQDLFSFDSAPEVDLFMSSGPAPSQQGSANSVFDPFSAPASAPQQQSQAQLFDPFGPTPVAASSAAAAFDPFASTPQQPTTYQQVPPPVPAFDPFAPVPVQQYNNNAAFPGQMQQQPSYQPAPFATNTPSNNFGMAAMGQPQLQQQPNNSAMYQAAPVANYSSAPQQHQQQQQQQQDADFGDFEAAPQTSGNQQQQQPAAKPANKWGDLGKLVDLSGINKNEVLAKPASTGGASYQQQSAFAGLDGFSKTPQNMANSGGMPGGARPLGSYGPTGGAPMGQGMRPAMGMGMGTPMAPQQPMGGMGMMGGGGGMQPGMNMNMGYGQPIMQQQPGGMMMAQPGGGMMMGGGMPMQGQQGGMMMGNYGMQPNNNMMGGGMPYNNGSSQQGMNQQGQRNGYGF